MSSHYEAPIRRPLIVGDKSYHDITVEVAAPVEGKANKLWWTAFTIALLAFLWNWSLGIKQNRWLGLGYHQLCMVGRYWSRRYVNFSSTFIVSSKMENGY